MGEQLLPMMLNWQKQFPKTEPLIKMLLRSYGGIMDQPTAISEKQIGGGLKLNTEVLRKQLQFLNTAGVLNYQPQKEKPQIRFIHVDELDNIIIRTRHPLVLDAWYSVSNVKG